MGKETKIGLLVGMCFIICFAVILSYRTDQLRTPTGASPHVAEIVRQAEAAVGNQLPPRHLPRSIDNASATATAARISGGVRDRVAARNPSNAEQVHESDTEDMTTDELVLRQRQNRMRMARHASGMTGPSLDELAKPLSDLLERFVARGPAIEASSQAAEGLAASESDLRGEEVDDREGHREPLRINRPQRDVMEDAEDRVSPRRGSIESSLAMNLGGHEDSTTVTNSKPVSLQADTPASASRTQRILTKHEVRSGDSLGRIAKKYYDSARPELIQAIFEANRDQMKDPDHVVCGRVLVIPLLEDRLAAFPSRDRGTRVAVESSVNNLAEKESPLIGRTYVVKSGDVLSKIASAYYSSASPEIVKAIFEANRQVMSDPDHLVAGCLLRLPDFSGTAESLPAGVTIASNATANVAAADRRSPAAVGGRGREGIDWEWYQVQKGDVYSTIAANRLGSAKRWPELARMNSDIFPDSGNIRHGVRIRVPRQAAGSGRVGGHRREGI